MPFQPEYSEFIKNELARLDAGNVNEKKRAQIARAKFIAVCQAPTSPTYTKNLPENYGAVRATERFKIFFKIHHSYNVVFFTWMNDEDSIHTSGAFRDSYQEFRRKLDNDEIEVYQHVDMVAEEFTFNGDWGNAYIYIEFNRTLSNETSESANSSLTLSQAGERDYIISSIDVSDENKGLASELLIRALNRADEGGVTVSYELYLVSHNLEKSRHLLSKFDFELTEFDDDVELWARAPRR